MGRMESKLKEIKRENFEQGIEAAYKLGMMDGQADIRNQLDDARKQLANMLTTNKHLYNLIDQKEDRAVKISPNFTRHLLDNLRRTKCYGVYFWLKKIYEKTTGMKYKKGDILENDDEPIKDRPNENNDTS